MRAKEAVPLIFGISLKAQEKEENQRDEQVKPQRWNVANTPAREVLFGEETGFKDQRNQTPKELIVECKIVCEEVFYEHPHVPTVVRSLLSAGVAEAMVIAERGFTILTVRHWLKEMPF